MKTRLRAELVVRFEWNFKTMSKLTKQSYKDLSKNFPWALCVTPLLFHINIWSIIDEELLLSIVLNVKCKM